MADNTTTITSPIKLERTISRRNRNQIKPERMVMFSLAITLIEVISNAISTKLVLCCSLEGNGQQFKPQRKNYEQGSITTIEYNRELGPTQSSFNNGQVIAIN